MDLLIITKRPWNFTQAGLAILLGLVVLLGAGCSSPDPIDFEFQDVRIGDEVTSEFESKFEFMSKPGEDDSRSFYNYLEIPSLRKSLSFIVTTLNGKVEAIDLNFDPGDFSNLKTAFIDKFGPPHISKESGQSLKWKSMIGTFSLTQTGGGIYSEKYDDHVTKRIQKREQDLKGSLAP